MDTTLLASVRTLIVGAMMGVSGLMLFARRLDRQAQNGAFYITMVLITVIIGGTLLLTLAGF